MYWSKIGEPSVPAEVHASLWTAKMGTRTVLLSFVLGLVTAFANGIGDCDFESGSCDYLIDTSADFVWNITSGETPSGRTGPSADHTTGSGSYAYIETSWPRLNRESARLISPQLSHNDGNCFTFHYHMYGLNIRTLNVYIEDDRGRRRLVWTLTGEQGNQWKFASVPLGNIKRNNKRKLKGNRHFKVIIEGVAGADYMGDIAVDDIVVKALKRPSDCPVLPLEAKPEVPKPTPPAVPPVVPVCGIKSHTRIVGGTQAIPNSWPWQAMLTYKSSSGEWKRYCGGTLILNDWILTAAHCVSDIRREDYDKNRVMLGAHYRNTTKQIGTEQTFDIKGIHFHPEYNSITSYNYDIALIHLNRPAITGKGVGLACLPGIGAQFSAGSNCWITGWGTLKSGGDSPEILQQAQVPLVTNKECSKDGSYPPEKITPQMLCAGFPAGGVDACQGDSGGPLVCQDANDKLWYLVGDTSWGYGCALPDYYGVYGRVQAHSDWIYTVLRDH